MKRTISRVQKLAVVACMSLFCVPLPLEAQEILSITGSDVYYCRYEVDGTTTLLKLASSPSTFTTKSVGKELAQLKKKRNATRAKLANQRALLKSIPNRLQLQGRREKIKNKITNLANEVGAIKALENNIRRCRDRELIQSDSMTITIMKVTNTLSGQFYTTAYASRPSPLRVSKNVFIGAGEWCLTFNGTGEIPFNFPSGTESQIGLTDSICPSGGVIKCEPSVPSTHIGWRIITAFNPPDVQASLNQLASRIGDLSITARPFVSGFPCRGLP